MQNFTKKKKKKKYAYNLTDIKKIKNKFENIVNKKL